MRWDDVGWEDGRGSWLGMAEIASSQNGEDERKRRRQERRWKMKDEATNCQVTVVMQPNARSVEQANKANRNAASKISHTCESLKRQHERWRPWSMRMWCGRNEKEAINQTNRELATKSWTERCNKEQQTSLTNEMNYGKWYLSNQKKVYGDDNEREGTKEWRLDEKWIVESIKNS